MKYALQQSTKLNQQYERVLKHVCKQQGLNYERTLQYHHRHSTPNSLSKKKRRQSNASFDFSSTWPRSVSFNAHPVVEQKKVCWKRLAVAFFWRHDYCRVFFSVDLLKWKTSFHHDKVSKPWFPLYLKRDKWDAVQEEIIVECIYLVMYSLKSLESRFSSLI